MKNKLLTAAVLTTISLTNINSGSCRKGNQNNQTNVESTNKDVLPGGGPTKPTIPVTTRTTTTKPTMPVTTRTDIIKNAISSYINDKSNRYPNANNVPNIVVSESNGKIMLQCVKFIAMSFNKVTQSDIRNEDSIKNIMFVVHVGSTNATKTYNFSNNSQFTLGQIISSLSLINKEIREDGEHYLAIKDKNGLLCYDKCYIKLSNGKLYCNQPWNENEYLAVASYCDSKFNNFGYYFHRDGTYSEINFDKSTKVDNQDFKNNFNSESNINVENHIGELSLYLDTGDN